ncbi:MAG: tetratricopeptide repeat protein, partial [Proteobacteria bacterium]|nr:tetratricopeptide repeat protein [Pseudomonadota bacterium]
MAFVLVTGGISLVSVSPSAEPVADRLLAGVRVSERPGCTIVRIEFNARAQYQSHFPLATGDELRIQVNPLDRSPSTQPPLGGLEALRAPTSERASIHAIELEQAASGSKLTVYFRRTVSFKVAQGIDFKSLLIAIAGPAPSANCLPVQDAATAESGAGEGWQSTVKPAAKAAPAGDNDARRAALLSEARTALQNSNPDRAVQLLTKIIEGGASAQRQEAQELLGLARERRGQLAHARAEYQDYLREFPSGAGADRVKARLAAIETAGDKQPATAPQLPPSGAQNIRLGTDSDAGAVTRPIAERQAIREEKSPSPWTISQYGSASTYYNLNQGGRGFIETPRTNVGWDREDPYKTYQNTFLSSLDYNARFDSATYSGQIRFSATEQGDLLPTGLNQTRISSLYFDGRAKEEGVSLRVGRQSSTSGGVLGRFDGVLGGYQWNETTKVTAVAGSPVELSSDSPFAHSRYFYGVGVESKPFGKWLETGAYYFEQFSEGLVERQSLGLEGRMVKDTFSAYGGVDYDIYFGQLNSFMLTGNKVFSDQSTASINLDYRRSPILLLSNALQGQGVYTLSELLRRYTMTEVDQLALDRTAQSYTATAAYARPLNSWLQWSSDLTINYLSGMPASAGVDAVAPVGAAYYGSTQLIGNGFFADGDTASVGLRYASTTTSDRYMVETSMNYPITRDWRVGSTVRLG